MSFPILYSQNAQEEIESAYHWIKARAPIAASKWREELISRIETLGTNPSARRLAAESSKFPQEIRQLLFGRRGGQYRILFMVKGEEVIILSLRHSRRQPLAEGDLPI